MPHDNSRPVYSTATGRLCVVCGWPERDCHCSTRFGRDAPLPARIVARLRVEKKGRGGKTVTVIAGLPANQPFLKTLCGELKRSCGVGGSVVDDAVELQGDQLLRVRPLLLQKGWTVKG